jgi:hypothetical protein
MQHFIGFLIKESMHKHKYTRMEVFCFFLCNIKYIKYFIYKKYTRMERVLNVYINAVDKEHHRASPRQAACEHITHTILSQVYHFSLYNI